MTQMAWRQSRNQSADPPKLSQSGWSGPACDAQQAERLAVTLGVEVLVEQAVEHRPGRRHDREQGRAGPQLHVVRGAEDLVSGSPLDAECGLGALHQPRTEDGMAEIRLGLREALDRESPRRRAEAQTLELRKDVPHPMRPLPAAPDLCQRRCVVVPLRLDEALQVVRVVGHAEFVLLDHDPPPVAHQSPRIRPRFQGAPHIRTPPSQ